MRDGLWRNDLATHKCQLVEDRKSRRCWGRPRKMYVDLVLNKEWLKFRWLNKFKDCWIFNGAIIYLFIYKRLLTWNWFKNEVWKIFNKWHMFKKWNIRKILNFIRGLRIWYIRMGLCICHRFVWQCFGGMRMLWVA